MSEHVESPKRARGRPKKEGGQPHPHQFLLRLSRIHRDGIEAKAREDGIPKTHAILDAIALHGTFKGERPALFGKPLKT